jgi:hypothetical protein
MRKFLTGITIAVMAIFVAGSTVFAQSSGNFNYKTGPTACVLNSNGSITGGVQCGPITTGGTCTTNADCSFGAQTCQGAIACTATGTQCAASGTSCSVGVDLVNGFCSGTGACSGTASKTCIGKTNVTIKTSSGKGNVFVVTPSAVIGLLTDVTVSSKQTTAISSALAGVDFSVTIPVAPTGSTAVPTPNFPVTYDSRFVQISTNLFQGLAATCTASAGGCFITFNESTVSAHSFNWVLGPLTSGDYGVTAQWTSSLADSGIASSMTCVGPLNLTIQQNKMFSPTVESSSDVTFP